KWASFMNGWISPSACWQSARAHMSGSAGGLTMAAPDRGTNPNTGFLYMFGGGALVALFISLAFVTRMIGPAAIPIWGVTMLAAIMIGVGPIGKAIGKRIAGETPDAIPEAPEEVYAELDDLR